MAATNTSRIRLGTGVLISSNRIGQLFQYWLRVDPARAATYQEAAGISDEQAAGLLGRAGNGSLIRDRSSAVMLPHAILDQTN